jgi:hypothetical protein
LELQWAHPNVLLASSATWERVEGNRHLAAADICDLLKNISLFSSNSPELKPKWMLPNVWNPVDMNSGDHACTGPEGIIRRERCLGFFHSKLSKRPSTSGDSSITVAIQPANKFGDAVWVELVKQGKVQESRTGMYEWVEVRTR